MILKNTFQNSRFCIFRTNQTSSLYGSVLDNLFQFSPSKLPFFTVPPLMSYKWVNEIQ